MTRFDPSVRREIRYVAFGTLALTALLVGGFAAFGHYSSGVLFGALLSGTAGVLNFILLAVTVTRALTYPPEEEASAKALMKASQIGRMLFLLAVLAVGVIFFDIWSTLITVFFPRVIIGVRSVKLKKEAPPPSPADPDGADEEPAEEIDGSENVDPDENNDNNDNNETDNAETKGSEHHQE